MRLSDLDGYIYKLSEKLHLGNNVMEGYHILKSMKISEIKELLN